MTSAIALLTSIALKSLFGFALLSCTSLTGGHEGLPFSDNIENKHTADKLQWQSVAHSLSRANPGNIRGTSDSGADNKNTIPAVFSLSSQTCIDLRTHRVSPSTKPDLAFINIAFAIPHLRAPPRSLLL